MKDKLYIITGSNGSSGSYIATRLSKIKTNHLLLLYHTRTERIKALFDKPNVDAHGIDLTNDRKLSRFLDKYLKSKPDKELYLIHTASVRSFDTRSFDQIELSDWQHVFNTNIYSTLNIIHALLPEMQERSFGRAVLFGSIVGTHGLPNGSAYAASKAAIINLAKSISYENTMNNVIFNVISPAPIKSVLSEDYKGDYLKFREEYFSNYLMNSVSGTYVEFEEIYKLCTLLLDPLNRNIHGQNITLGGTFL